MGKGNFILPLNSEIRKKTGIRQGETVTLKFEKDPNEIVLDIDFMECLAEEETGMKYFQSLPGSHQKYFSKWIQSAKTDETKAKRIAKAVNALARKMNFNLMLREKD